MNTCWQCKHLTTKHPAPGREGESCDYCRAWRKWLPVGTLKDRPGKECEKWEEYEKNLLRV